MVFNFNITTIKPYMSLTTHKQRGQGLFRVCKGDASCPSITSKQEAKSQSFVQDRLDKKTAVPPNQPLLIVFGSMQKHRHNRSKTTKASLSDTQLQFSQRLSTFQLNAETNTLGHSQASTSCKAIQTEDFASMKNHLLRVGSLVLGKAANSEKENGCRL